MRVSPTITDLANRTCRLCDAVTSHTCRGQHEEKGVAYTLYECNVCRGQWWDPFVNPGAEWYERDERYTSRNHDPILHANEKHVGALRYFASEVGTVLDVGCGVGNFLAYAQTIGWRGWGIDFDADAVAAGKETFGLRDLEVSDLATFVAQHPELRFDLVTFFDVFEHLDNHHEFLTLVAELLRPRGHIALSVPYRHAWRFLIPADLPPRHLTRWDERSLAYILKRHGFEVRLTKRTPATWYYLVLKLRFRYGSWTSFGLVRQARQRAVGAARVPSLRPPIEVRFAQFMAKVKDMLLFGLPAALLWIGLLPFRGRYTNLYVVAQRYV